MGNSLKVALALGVGYFLGRSHKTRLALVLAAGAATGGFGGFAKRALASGGKHLAASETLGKLSPELGNVVDSLKDDLAEAGKAAAKAAISSKLDSVADSIHDRTEALRGQAVAHAGEAESQVLDGAAEARKAGRRTEEEEDRPEEHAERRRRPEAEKTSDRPRHAPRPRPSDDVPSDRPRSSDRGRSGDRQPAPSRAGRPASDHRDGGE